VAALVAENGRMPRSGDPAETQTGIAAPPRGGRRGEDFYVAGGPVAPDRRCYITRATDLELLRRLAAGDYCHVIAPRFSGKSSLVARAASQLRANGALAAVIDLSQLGSRDGSTEVGRWYYGLAYRVMRDLRIKLDLQAWWQDRMPLPPAQRLGEFFWEIVIGATRAPVTIFLDEIDSVEQLDYATELFGIVRACHDARAGEPEYQRLNFVLLGAALPAGKAARAGIAAAEIGVRLELSDFSFDEARPLAEGLEMPSGDAERALYRILYWTGGHPYLTQKLCQAVARNAARINSDAAVDRLVTARFFARNAVVSETSMSRVLDGLDRAGKLARPALRLYRRIRRGRRPRYEQGNPEHELLRVCGLVKLNGERRLVVRNRIYAEVFTHRWAREALPVEWRRIGRVAAVTALVAGALWGYAEVLPRPYEETLRVSFVELDEAVEAWSSMRRIPGFGKRADRLLSRVLIRASRQAANWPAAAAIDERLRALSGYEARADALLVEFWERRAEAAEAAEHRDDALLYRLRAYQAGPTADAGLAAELAGGGYQQLRTVIRPAGLVEALSTSEEGQRVVTVSAGNVVERWDAGTGLPAPDTRLELLVEEFVTVRRRLSLDTGGRVSQPRVELALEHPRPEDLHILLTAPSGRSVELPSTATGAAGGRLVFDERRAPALRALRGEPTLGTWVLEIEDRASGQLGFFQGWVLQASPAARHRAEDRPENALLLPAPSRTSAVRSALSPRGSMVAALPRNPEARGRLQTWEISTARPLASIPVGAGERWIGFADESSLLFVAGAGAGEELRVLDAATGAERFVHRSEARYVAGPAMSPDGQFLAVAESTPQVAWIRSLDSGREVFRLPAAGETTAVAVGPGGLLLAIADRGNVVRVWHATDGGLLAEFPQDAAVAALAFDPSGRWLATVDATRQVRVWDLTAPDTVPVLSRRGGELRQFAFDRAGRQFALLGPVGGYELWSLQEGMPAAPVLPHPAERTAGSGAVDRPTGTRLALTADGLLVGGQGTRSVRCWDTHRAGPATELPRIAPVVALAPSGLRMAAGLSDGRVILRMRDPDSLVLQQAMVTTGELRHGGAVTALDFSPDSTRLVSVGSDGSVLLWDAATGQAIGGLFQHGSGRVMAIDLGADGRRLVTAGELGARSWDAETGTPGPDLGPGRMTSAVTLDPVGQRAFTGTVDGEVESWDVASGERLWFGEIGAPVSRLAVSADGARIAAASNTGLVQAWGMGTAGRPLSVALPAPVIGLRFSADGKALIVQTASWMHRLEVADGRLRVAASRLLPAAAPPGAWRSATADGMRVVLVGGAHSETMAVLDFERAPLPPEDWRADLDGWQHKLKLYFTADGELQAGIPPAPAAGEDEALASDEEPTAPEVTETDLPAQ
jgi:WD40 repeat protein